MQTENAGFINAAAISNDVFRNNGTFQYLQSLFAFNFSVCKHPSKLFLNSF